MKSFDAYLRDAEQAHGHLCAGQILGVRLGTIHNLHYYLELMRQIRAAIATGTLATLAERVMAIPRRVPAPVA